MLAAYNGAVPPSVRSLAGSATGSDYRWSIQGGTLRLTLLRDTGPGPGIPDQVYQRVFYTAAPFQRQK
jgi:hypothetical protein